MLKSYKTEISLKPKQKEFIIKSIGVNRFLYNLFISTNKENHQKGIPYMDYNQFYKYINNTYIKNNPDKTWILEVNSKSRRESLKNADKAYKDFFKGKSKFPKFKKKGKNDPKFYFFKNDNKHIIESNRYRIKIPSLGYVHLKEKGYIPTNDDKHIIKHGSISHKSGRFYISVTVDIKEDPIKKDLNKEGLGIDLGIKTLLTLSNGDIYKNINKDIRIKKIEKKLKKEQRSLSRMLENKRKGESAADSNIKKQILIIQKIYKRLSDIRTDYENKVIHEIVKTKPSYISLEDLNVKGMMKNRHLSKEVQSCRFNQIKNKLIFKAKEKGIEIRIIDRFYPSSKLCHHCGSVKKDLKLKDRTYKCDCGYIEDRDLNAALNLRDSLNYVLV